MEIPLPQSQITDIFSYNFDKKLYRFSDVREITEESNPVVYNQFQQINSSLLSSGGLSGVYTLVEGNIQSANFVSGSTGWKIDSEGNIEANDGNFRGDITGATGTFSGSLVANSLDIPDAITANSFHVDTNGNVWWGATAIDFATAKVLNTGVSTFNNLTITGGTITGMTITAGTIRSSSGDDRIELTSGDALLIYDSGTIVMQMTNAGIAWSAGATPTWFMSLLNNDLIVQEYGSDPVVKFVFSTGDDFYPFHANAELGTTSKRWEVIWGNNIRGTNIYCTNQTADQHITGDLLFKEGDKIVFRIDETSKYLNFYNEDKELIAKLSKKGDFHIKGNIKKLK